MEKTKSIKEKIVQISNELRLNKEGKNAFQKYDYFRPDDIAKAINPLMEKYRLIIMFNLPFNKDKGMYEGELSIEGLDTDEKIVYKFDIPLTKVQGTSEAQGAGATMTYCKRYMIMNVFNIAENSADLDSMNYKEKKETKTSQDDICPKCGSPAKYKEGIKNGKHWQGWFCQNQKCKNVVWGPKYDNNKSQAEQEEADSVPEDPFDNLDR